MAKIRQLNQKESTTYSNMLEDDTVDEYPGYSLNLLEMDVDDLLTVAEGEWEAYEDTGDGQLNFFTQEDLYKLSEWGEEHA